jgi:quinol monooxygenase YgiN
MRITRINEFQAKDGQGDVLRGLLASTVPLIESSDGCQSCQILQSLDDPTRIMMLEVWDSIEAHQASLKNIPPGTFKKMTGILAGPPKGEYFSA